MATEDTFTIEITNQLSSGVKLEINGEYVVYREHASYTMSTPAPVMISRQGDTVSVTIPNSIQSDTPVVEGICVCMSKTIDFMVTPSASMNITLQTGYFTNELPDGSRGVRCGDGF